MKVIFYVLDIVKTVLRHICMLCEHFKHHHHDDFHRKETDDGNIENKSAEDYNTEKGNLGHD